jgi:hypothetical protein
MGYHSKVAFDLSEHHPDPERGLPHQWFMMFTPERAHPALGDGHFAFTFKPGTPQKEVEALERQLARIVESFSFTAY